MKKVLVILMIILMVGVVVGECKEDPLSSLDKISKTTNFNIPEGCLNKYIGECSKGGATFNTFGKLNDDSQKKVIDKLLEDSKIIKVGEILNGYKDNGMDVGKAAELFGKIGDSENQKKVFSKIKDSALRTKILSNAENCKKVLGVNKFGVSAGADFKVSGSGEKIIINGQEFDMKFFKGMNVQIGNDGEIFLNNVGYKGNGVWIKNEDDTVSLNGHKIKLPGNNNQKGYTLTQSSEGYLSVEDNNLKKTPFLSKKFELDLSGEEPIIVDGNKKFSSIIGDGFFSLDKQYGKYTISTSTHNEEKLTSTIDPQLIKTELVLNKGYVNKEFMQISLDKTTLFNGQNMNLIKTDNGIKINSEQSVQVVDSGLLNFNILNIDPGKDCEFSNSYEHRGTKKLNIIDGKGGVTVFSGERDVRNYFKKNPKIDEQFYNGLKATNLPIASTPAIPEKIQLDDIWKKTLLENTVYDEPGIPEEYNLQDFGGEELELREAQDRFEETIAKVQKNPKDPAAMGELQSQLQTMYNSASEDDKKTIRSIAQTLATKDNQIKLTEPLTIGQTLKSLCLWCDDNVDRTTITYPIIDQKAAAKKLPVKSQKKKKNVKATDVKELSETKLVTTKATVGKNDKVEVKGNPVTVQTVKGGATLTSGNAKLTIVKKDSDKKTIDITIGTTTASHSGALVVTGITGDGETLAVGENQIYLTDALETGFYEYISPAEGLVYTTAEGKKTINIPTVAIPKKAETKTMEMNGKTYTYQTVAMTKTSINDGFKFGQRFAVVNSGSDEFNHATMHYIPLDQVYRVVDNSNKAKQLKAADEAKIKAYFENLKDKKTIDYIQQYSSNNDVDTP